MLVALLAMMGAGQVLAAYSQVIAFGDSLSDTGNLYKLSLPFLGGYPGEPYYQGRFSNGAVAVEAMAADLGVPVTSYAVGGAQTGLDNQGGPFLDGTGVTGQIMSYAQEIRGRSSDPNALYFVWAGPNDFLTGGNIWSPTSSSIAYGNMVGNVDGLYYLGARHFFIPLMPDLSLTPVGRQSGVAYQAAAALRTDEYNHLLLEGMSSLATRYEGMNVILFDTAGFMSAQIPSLQATGVETVAACFNISAGTTCQQPDAYLFWDGQHPTAFTNQMLGRAFASAVPEPGVPSLMGIGAVLMLMHAGRRRKPLLT